MKQIRNIALSVVLAVSALLFAGCGKSQFGLTENTEKRMVLTAQNADKGDFFMVGTLVVDEGEQIVIASDLSKGSIRVEMIESPASQSAEDMLEFSGNTIITADLNTTEGASGTVPAGDYMLKATCLEKASGTVTIEVKPAS